MPAAVIPTNAIAMRAPGREKPELCPCLARGCSRQYTCSFLPKFFISLGSSKKKSVIHGVNFSSGRHADSDPPICRGASRWTCDKNFTRIGYLVKYPIKTGC